MTREHVDVLIVGAGISGIGAACRLQERCPGKTFAIVEARGAIGGTWDLFRFPGIRSDSDMFTLSYPFRPWQGAQAIADGWSIRNYIEETARALGVDERIRFRQRVVAAEWSSAESRWAVEIERVDTGETFEMTCGFLFSCTGYYRYDEGHTPEFVGIERFGGEVVHPQFWTDDIDHGGKRIVVIGSGATAITLIPPLSARAARVTMLQRSPSYIISLPAVDPLARVLVRALPTRFAYPLVRGKNVLLALAIYGLSRHRPTEVRRLIRMLNRRRLPPGYDIDTHFKPSYEPWDQRMCIVPDGDFFDSISAGRVSVVTDRIKTFTETGIALESGAALEADMVVTATGLELLPIGGIRLNVDGEDVDVGKAFAYRGMMLSGVPNMAYSFGYTNQSWTLGSDLTAREICTVLRHMDRYGHTQCTPRVRDPEVTPVQFIDLSSGYVRRAMDRFPKQGSRDPWRREQSYTQNRRAFRRRPIDDPALEFSRAASAAPPRRRPSPPRSGRDDRSAAPSP